MFRSALIAAAAVGLLAGCAGTATESGTATEAPSAPATGAAEPTTAPETPVAAGDPSDPCSLLTADEINAALGTSFEPSTATPDPARQIVTCNYKSADGTQIVDLGVSQTPGADAFDTNRDLAPAYFGGNAKVVSIPGADKAYLVIAETFDAPVIGMLVKGKFVLLQVGVDGTTTEAGEALAAQVAARMP